MCERGGRVRGRRIEREAERVGVGRRRERKGVKVRKREREGGRER